MRRSTTLASNEEDARVFIHNIFMCTGAHRILDLALQEICRLRAPLGARVRLAQFVGIVIFALVAHASVMLDSHCTRDCIRRRRSYKF